MNQTRKSALILSSLSLIFLMIGVSSTAASFSDTGTSRITATGGTFDYIIEGAFGESKDRVSIGHGELYPGVPEFTTSVTIKNKGNTGIKYEIRSLESFTDADGYVTTRGPANDKINVKITHGSTVIYNGKVKDAISVYSPEIPPGTNQTINFTWTWPVSSDDYLYNRTSSLAIFDFYVTAT